MYIEEPLNLIDTHIRLQRCVFGDNQQVLLTYGKLYIPHSRPIAFDHDHQSIRGQVSGLGRQSRFLTGMINFRNEIGYTDQQGSLSEFYSLLRGRFDELVRALDIILQRPHHQLVRSGQIGRPKAQYMNNTQSMNYLIKHPHQRHHKALNMVKEITYDTQENRLIKYWVKCIHSKLARIKERYQKMWRQTDDQLLGQIESFQNVLAARLREPMMRAVSNLTHGTSFSLVMQMAVGYRDVYKLYLIMMRGLSLTDACYEISTKNVAELYEYWCFIKLGAILRNRYPLVSHDVIKTNSKGLFVTLETGKSSELVFRHPITQEQFKLRYNPKSTKLPTVTQKPDNMLELRKEMANVDYKYIFDAKYKVDYKELTDGQMYERPMEQDINTMHRYRDAIVYENKAAGQYERTVFGAFVLFPGHEEKLYQEDDFYQSIGQVGIGGFPFLPSQTELVGDFLEQLIDESGHTHYKAVQLPQGMTTYLEDTQIHKRNVLIGNVTGSEQLEGIQKHLIYHIPLSKIRHRMLGIEYVAIYESKRYGIGGIRYWGKVKSMEITPRRRLLRQFPTTHSNLDEEYVVYTLEELVQRPEPIRAEGTGLRDRRYTNKTLLDYATTLSELSIQTQEEFQLYLALKRVTNAYSGGDLAHGERYAAQIGDQQISIDSGQLIVAGESGETAIDLEIWVRNPVKVMKQIVRL